jgi:hypothetical protein
MSLESVKLVLFILSIILFISTGENQILTAFKPSQESGLKNENSENPPSPTTLETIGECATFGMENVTDNGSGKCVQLGSDHQEENTSNKDSSESTLSEYLLFENATYGVALKYPPDWSYDWGPVLPLPYPLITLYSPESDDYAIVDLTIDDISGTDEPKDLKSYLAESMKQSNAFNGFNVIRSGTTGFLNGKPAYIYEAKFDDSVADGPSGPKRLTEIGTLEGEFAYQLRLIGNPDQYNRYLPVFENIVKSFKITR